VLVKLNSLELGGTQLNALDFARGVAAHGVASILVGYRETMPSSGPNLLDVASDRGLEVELLDKGASQAEAGSWATRFRRAQELAEFADRREIDVVHSYSAAEARAAFWGPCRLGRRPHVITAYEMAVPRRVYTTPPLVVGTQYLVEDLAGRRGPVHLISPPVDLRADRPDESAAVEFARTWGLESNRLTVVVVTRLAESMKARGVEVAVQAMEELGGDGVDLVVVGGGEAEQRLRARANIVNERVRRRVVVFTGPLADPRPAYAAADVVIGMGGSAARGLAFGKPLIVTGENGWFRTFMPDTAADLFRNSFWSLDTDPDPVRSLVAQVRALGDPGVRVPLGLFGREFAEAHFGMDAMVRRLADVYREARELRQLRTGWLVDLPVEGRTIVAQLLGRPA
jgi:glycosyltransferase involved in cell wall biosynthesis